MPRKVCDKFRSSLYLILSLLLLIFLASCYPVFKNPIPPPPKLKADHQILGTWVRTTKSGSKEQLSIFQRKRSSGWIDVVYIYEIDSKTSGDGITVLVLEGYRTSVNRQQLLCLRFRAKEYNFYRAMDNNHSDQEVAEFPFLIVNYQTTSSGELIVKPFSTLKVEELIKDGKLKGEIVKEDVLGVPLEDVIKGQTLDKVTVTSSSDELIDVISREGLGAFIVQDSNNIFVFSRSKP